MYISSGESVTVDIEDLSKRLDGAINKMERTLSKAQKAVGIQVDATGKLVNAQGKLVEGLTLSQVKLGQYVDDVGKIHTANGEFVADLNKIEQQLGFYADAMGNVRNAQGDFIRLTNEASKAAADQAKAQNDAAKQLEITQQLTRKAFSDSFKGFADTSTQITNLIGVFAQGNGALSDMQKKVASIAQAFSISFNTFKGVTDLASGLSTAAKTASNFLGNVSKLSADAGANVGALTNAAAKLSPAMAAMGGPVGIAVAGVAALGAGITAAVAANSKTHLLSDSFKEIEANAKAAGDSIKSLGDALKYGALATPLNDYEKALKKLDETAQKLAEAQARYREQLATADRYVNGDVPFTTYVSAAPVTKAEAERDNAWAEYSNEVKKLVNAAREEQKTEAERLQDQRNAYADILTRIQADAELAKDVDAQRVLNNQITALDAKIEEAKNKAANEAQAAALKAQEDARNAAGVSQFLTQEKKALALTVEAYNVAAIEWQERAGEFGLSQDQIKIALANYKQAVDAAAESALASQLGVDFNAPHNTAFDLNAKFETLANALDDGQITADKYYNALRQLQEQRAKQLDVTAAENKTAVDLADAENKRAVISKQITDELTANRLSEAEAARLIDVANKNYANAVDQLNNAARASLEKLTGVTLAAPVEPLKEYAEKLGALNKALNDGLITQEEFNAANAQLTAIRDKEAKAAADKAAQEAAAARSATGLDAFIQAGEKLNKTAADLINDQFEKIKQAAEKGIISEEDLTRARKSRAQQLVQINAAEKAKIEQEKQARKDAMRSALGVDSLMQELKTPLEVYRETMEQVAQAARAGAVTNAERLALENKAADDYWAAFNKTAQAAEKAASSIEKSGPAKSMGAGSEALYLAQIRNSTANYQTAITNATTKMAQTSEENLDETRNTNALLADVVETLQGLQTYAG